ncbi:MAG: FMN-binding protein [Micrococcales bacterium]|nr:FMN-binding protein [Microbacteriaceae bacterium]NBR22989.1 FMN-binding protein [Micrococcales bacterium]NBX94335.1 FMN-binding protein [Actinomycetota bacterium]NBR77563.1 FMN-binding protein [Microbacteriaceae bacterium]NBS61177.1 FMN-binding protein [Microbacteriaceae bacterium]
MRKSTQALMGTASLLAVVTGFQVGANATPSASFSPIPTTPTTDPTPTVTPTTPSPTGTPTTDPTTTPKPTKTPTKTPTPKPTKKPTPPPSSTVSHTSSPVNYRYGTVQLTVTKTGSSITSINLDQAGATNGRASSFPYLVQLAINAQSGSFDTSMLSGATYSVNAFMSAFNDALAQF